MNQYQYDTMDETYFDSCKCPDCDDKDEVIRDIMFDLEDIRNRLLRDDTKEMPNDLREDMVELYETVRNLYKKIY